MSELDDRLRKLEIELEALQRIKTQEDYDEGARLHAIHNAPWVKGQYSHIEFPPYVYREFPKAIYGVGFLEARAKLEAANMVPAFGTNDVERKQGILLAEREIANYVKKVGTEQELRRWLSTGTWFETTGELEQRAASLQKSIETAAAHRAYEDRNMGEGAKRQIEAFDDAAEDFVAEIPRTPGGPKGKRVMTTGGTQTKASGGAQHGEGQKQGKATAGTGRRK